MGSLRDRMRRRREKSEQRKQEQLEQGLAGFEAGHATVIEELKAVGTTRQSPPSG